MRNGFWDTSFVFFNLILTTWYHDDPVSIRLTPSLLWKRKKCWIGFVTVTKDETLAVYSWWYQDRLLVKVPRKAGLLARSGRLLLVFQKMSRKPRSLEMFSWEKRTIVFSKRNKQDCMWYFFFIHRLVRAVVYSKSMTIADTGMILGITGRTRQQ